jgi:hypothetical protein
VAAAVAVDATALADRFAVGAKLLGAAALLSLAAGLALRLTAFIPVGLALLGAAYALALETRGGTVDGGALLVAPALLLAAELAYRSLEPRGIRPERSLVAGDAAVLLALLGGSVVASGVLLSATAVDIGGRAPLVAAGVAAATGALALTASLARRGGSS